MKLTPIRKRLLIMLEPENRVARGLAMPDLDTIRYCRRCLAVLEALDAPCTGEDIIELDARRDRYVFRGRDRSHDIDSVSVPVVIEKTRTAIVLAGTDPDVPVGARVLVAFDAGKPADPDDRDGPFRLVPAGAVLALVEEGDDKGEEGHATDSPAHEDA